MGTNTAKPVGGAQPWIFNVDVTSRPAGTTLAQNAIGPGKYGIHSAAQFLASPVAQERALTDFLNDIERQPRANGSFDFVGTTIDGRRARFTIARAGLLGAGHRQGAKDTRGYLDDVQSSGFSSARARLTREQLRLETRLRTFADLPYE